MKRISALVGIAALALLGLVSTGHAQVINGSFETGDLSGWTLVDTPNGYSNVKNVVSFDTSGLGASKAAQFSVGTVDHYLPGTGGIQMFQTITLPASHVFLSLDLAVANVGIYTNVDAGRFTLLLDNVAVAFWNAGSIAPGATLRNELTFETDVIAGSHLLGLQVVRSYGSPGTLFQYVDDVRVDVQQAGGLSAVPEPSTYGFMGAGALLTIGLLRRRAGKRA